VIVTKDKSPQMRGFSINQKPLTIKPYPMKIQFQISPLMGELQKLPGHFGLALSEIFALKTSLKVLFVSIIYSQTALWLLACHIFLKICDIPYIEMSHLLLNL
jgi:hypothetical protein